MIGRTTTDATNETCQKEVREVTRDEGHPLLSIVSSRPTVSSSCANVILVLSSIFGTMRPVSTPLLPVNPINRSFLINSTPPPTLDTLTFNRPSLEYKLSANKHPTVDAFVHNPAKGQARVAHVQTRPIVNLPVANIITTSESEVDEESESQVPALPVSTEFESDGQIKESDNDEPDDASDGSTSQTARCNECSMANLKVKQLTHRLKTFERKWLTVTKLRDNSIIAEMRGIRDQLTSLTDSPDTVTSIQSRRQTVDLIKINKLYQMTDAVLSDRGRQCVDISVSNKQSKSDKQLPKHTGFRVPALSTLNRCFERQLIVKQRQTVEANSLNHERNEQNITLTYSERQFVFLSFVSKLRQLHTLILRQIVRPQVLSPSIINKSGVEHKYDLSQSDRDTISLCISNKLSNRDWERVNELSIGEQRILYQTKLKVQKLWAARMSTLDDHTVVEVIAASATVLVLLALLSG